MFSDTNKVAPFECGNSSVRFPLPCSQFQICQLGGQVSAILMWELVKHCLHFLIFFSRLIFYLPPLPKDIVYHNGFLGIITTSSYFARKLRWDSQTDSGFTWMTLKSLTIVRRLDFTVIFFYSQPILTHCAAFVEKHHWMVSYYLTRENFTEKVC